MNHIGLAAITMLAGSAVLSGAGNPVSKWNELTVQATLTAGEGPVPQSRTLPIVQVAIHDALNSIEPRYERYAFRGDIHTGASVEAAIATAGHDALVGALIVATSAGFGTSQQHAKAVVLVDAERDAELAAIPEGYPKSLGIAIGRAAAAAIIKLRSNDLSTTASQVPYTVGISPGDWQPTPNPDPASPAGVASYLPASQPGWGLVTPFVLRRSDQFEPDGPPRLSSSRYARDYNEVKEIGSQFSATRTGEQTVIAKFWYENASAIWSRFARVVAYSQGLDWWETARLLALINLAMGDGIIGGWQAKYDFNFWRPVTAIRAGDTDGNDATVGDPAWSSFLNTPPQPDYPSTHSVVAGAGAQVLRRFFHTDYVPFTATSGVPFPALTRSFTSFSEAAAENANARVYAGIHSRSAVEDGTRQGERIGQYVYTHALRPLDRDHDSDLD
jgi:PAP2 superfamily